MNENNTQKKDVIFENQDVKEWTEENKESIRQQINRTDVESQKAENIVYYFTQNSSEEHNPYAPDKTPGAPMEEKSELTFTVTPEKLEREFGTVRNGVSFLITAIEEYTVFIKHTIERDENEHEETIIRLVIRNY
jgi:hypothetical protein